PGDFFVGDGAGIGTVAGGGIADLAEVSPERNMFALKVLVEHGDHADGEVAGDAARDLEKAQRRGGGGLGVPLGQFHHVLDDGANGVDLLDVARDAVTGIHVAEGGVFPTGNKHG